MEIPKNEKWAWVLGGGTSGESAGRLLKTEGYSCILFDKNQNQSLIWEKTFSDSEIPENLEKPSFLVKSPGISPEHKILKFAKKTGIAVLSEIDLGRKKYSKKIIGITGTDGKSTTTSLTYHLVSKDFPEACVGGNLGAAFTSLPLEKTNLAVLELSSYQLEDSKPLNLDCSAILNLAPDHLERHKTMENYAKAKLKIVNSNDPAHVFVTKLETLKSLFTDRSAFSCDLKLVGYTEDSDAYILPEEKRILTKNYAYSFLNFSLSGKHNIENLAFSILLAESVGAIPESIQTQIESFVGLPHRFETIGEYKGWKFINDSKSTNIHSCLSGLNGFTRKDLLLLILAGIPKAEDPEPLFEKLLELEPLVLHVGKPSTDWEPWLEKAGANRFEKLSECMLWIKNHLAEIENSKQSDSSFPQNSIASKTAASTQKVVLFSPAGASFDQYKNFEERGNDLKKIFLNHF